MKFASIATTVFFAFQSVSTTDAFVVNNRNAVCRSSYNKKFLSLSSSESNALKEATAETTSENENEKKLSPEFEAAFTQVSAALKASVESPSMVAPLLHFTKEYFTACNDSNLAGNDKITAEQTSQNMMDAMQHAMTYGLKDKYQFGVTHTALRGKDPEEEDGNTVDFYKFGCEFFRPAMDYDNCVVLGQDALDKAMEQIDNGENVVFFANHQSEADPQVMSVLLEKAGYEQKAEELIYVAGHKVTTDLLAIPFSMGRNLICIHSKKHIDADPDTKPFKSRQNLMAMNGMLKKMRKGGAAIWVAPSGGRDRRDVETGEVPIAPFDQKTIDMFRLMGNKSKVPTHYYALSMVSYDICPPPDFVDPGVGEQRNVRFVPLAIKVNEELENVGGVETRHLFTDLAMKRCQEGYDECLAALEQQ